MTRIPGGLISEILATAESPAQAQAMLEKLEQRLAGIEKWAAARPLPTEPAARCDNETNETKSWREVLGDAPPPPSAADRRAWWADRSLSDDERAVLDRARRALDAERSRGPPAARCTTAAGAVRLVAHWHHLNAGHHEGDRHDEMCEWCARGEFGVQYRARKGWAA
jgi:hypothetical protein